MTHGQANQFPTFKAVVSADVRAGSSPPKEGRSADVRAGSLLQRLASAKQRGGRGESMGEGTAWINENSRVFWRATNEL